MKKIILAVLFVMVAKIDFIRQVSGGIYQVDVSFYKDGAGWQNDSYIKSGSYSAIEALKQVIKSDLSVQGAKPQKYRDFVTPKNPDGSEMVSVILPNLEKGNEIE